MTHASPSPLRSADSFLAELRQHALDARGSPLGIDLAEIAEMRPAEAAVVANGLLGSLGSVPLEVEPIARDQLGRLARRGVYFALANREGYTGIDPAQRQLIDLDAWKRTWSPASQSAQRSLFSQAALGETDNVPEPFGPYHAAFVQPHLSGLKAPQSEVTRVLHPWLRKLLPGHVEQSFLDDVGGLVDELVDNVREHGSRTASEQPSRSLVQVAVTRGKINRLHISVHDTGKGIMATARPKLPAALASLGDLALVRSLLTGSAGTWHRARGMGLPRIWRIVQRRRGARVLLATGAVRLRGAGNDKLEGKESSFELEGTLVHAQFVIPRPHGVGGLPSH